MRRPSGDDGNAVLEFVVLATLVMVPLIYVMLAVLQVQGTAYGVTEAAREAGRAYVEADSTENAFDAACAAATVALRNQSSTTFDCSQLTITCVSAGACGANLTPGETIRVDIDLDVDLPFLPKAIFGQPLTVSVHGVHDEVVDAFRAAR